MRPGAPTCLHPHRQRQPETLSKEPSGSTEPSLRNLDEETKLQREEVTYPGSHSNSALKTED